MLAAQLCASAADTPRAGPAPWVATDDVDAATAVDEALATAGLTHSEIAAAAAVTELSLEGTAFSSSWTGYILCRMGLVTYILD